MFQRTDAHEFRQRCRDYYPRTTMKKPDEFAEADEKRFANMRLARKAIVDHAGPWKKGSGNYGSLPCPVCNTGALRFSRAGSNGHIHAQCSTPDCVSWME